MLNAKGFRHWKLSLAVALVMLVGLAAACVPADLTTNVSNTSRDVAALKGDLAAIKGKLDAMGKAGEEPKAIERESKDQVIRGRADLLDYRMDYDNFKKAILGTPPGKAQQGKPGKPGKPGIVTTELAKLRDALAGTPAKKGVQGKPGTPAKPGLLASRADVASLTKSLDGIKAQLDRIEKALAAPAAPAAPAPAPKTATTK